MELEESHKANFEDLDDLVFGMSALQVSALTHAAKLSPLISGCTLGPRSASCTECVAVSESTSNKENQENSQKNVKKVGHADKVKGAEGNSSKDCGLGGLNVERKALDFNVFNSTALLRSVERQRRDEVKRAISQRQELVKVQEQKRMQVYERSIQEREKRLAEKLEIDKQIAEEVEDYAKTASEESQKYFDSLRRDEKKKLRRISLEVISLYQKNFRGVYEKIAKLLPTMDRKRFVKIEEYNKLLKVLVINFENLKQKVRNESIGLPEVKFAANLLTNVEMIYAKLYQEAEKLNDDARIEAEQQREAEQTRAIQEQAIIQEQQQQQAQLQQSVSVTDGAPKTDAPSKSFALASFISAERLEVYNELMGLYYQDKLDKYNRVMADESLKKVRSSWQKSINIPINTISAVSSQHLKDKFDKIYNFISGNVPKTVDNPVSPADHPLGRDFCLVLLAKKLVSQGETTVSSNAQAAFPIAAIIVALWQKVPEFGKLFLACIYAECPYLVPYFIPQFRNQSAEDYCRVLGYKIIDGVLEKQDMYLKRQSGIARLYSAVMITQPRQNFGPNPFGLENGWRWLCNILNLDPLPDICATVILEFLQTAGTYMWATYGRQFSKVILTLQHQYIAKLSKVDEGGPKARLEVFLMKALKEGRIELPSGVLAQNFW